MEDTIEKAYVEVLEVINNLEEEEKSKIPQEKIDFYEKNKDKNYKFTIDTSADLDKQKLSRKAYAVIIALYLDYFADEDEKNKLNKVLQYNQNKEDKMKRERYNPDNIFKKTKTEDTISNIEESNNELLPVPIKEHWYTKILNFFKAHFKKN